MFTTSRSIKAASVTLAAALSMSAVGAASAQGASARASAPYLGISPTTQTVASGTTVVWGVAVNGGTAPMRIAISYGDGTSATIAYGTAGTNKHVFRYCAARTHTFGQRFTVTDAQGRKDSVTSTVTVTYSGPICA